MLTRGDITRAEQIRNRQVELINESYANRHQSQAAQRAWEDACHDFHQTTLAPDYLWSDEAQMKIRSGDREAVNDALLFLEVDPWYFRSGYLKEKLIDSLKQAPITEDDRARIQGIIVSAAAGRNRREFKRFCRLATRVTSCQFEHQIEQLAKERDPESSGKFGYLLRYLEQHRVK